MQNGTKATIKYTYDALDNIETITEGTTLKQKYYYDALNQLIREDNKDLNKTITYEYDTGGNILNKKEYAYTTGTTLQNPTSVVEYAYGNTNWKDQLTSYNGKTITYDAIGNPLTYDGNTYTWKNGRELARIQNTSKNTDISYKYNDSGIRIEKTVNGTTTKYHLDGTKVIYEQTGNDMTRYMYDENNQVVGMDNNGSIYYLVRNGQGDVIGLLDNNLNEVARYTYDTWGKVIAVTDSAGNAITDTNNIAHKNPYRYRGYRYDAETGLYYLQSRYYNPEWSRFVNADGLVSTGQGMLSHNMYVYCENNCVNFGDATGTARKPIGFKPFGKEIPKLGSNNTITRVSVTNSSKKLPDYSNALNKLVQKNIEIAEKKSPLTDTAWFYKQVNHEGDWDYKRKNAWEAEFNEPFLEYDGKFLWNGKVTTAEQFGNIHYGIVGTAMGYSPFALYSGGGVAKLGLIKYVLTAWPPYWGDDPEDHYYIKQGINMYNSR